MSQLLDAVCEFVAQSPIASRYAAVIVVAADQPADATSIHVAIALPEWAEKAREAILVAVARECRRQATVIGYRGPQPREG